MLTWYEPLYVSESLKRRESQIRRRLDAGRTDVGHYVITLASNGLDELDVIASAYLTQRILLARLPMVVGIAGTKKEALEIVQRITEDCLRETGTAAIRIYLTGRQKSDR